jgi:hypothetical protein
MRIFGPQREEIIGEWRKFPKEELHNLYYSPEISVGKSRRMRWAGHIVHMRRQEMHT